MFAFPFFLLLNTKTALLKWAGWPAVAGLHGLMAAVTVVATWLASETYQHDIEAQDHRERDLAGERLSGQARA